MKKNAFGIFSNSNRRKSRVSVSLLSLFLSRLSRVPFHDKQANSILPKIGRTQGTQSYSAPPCSSAKRNVPRQKRAVSEQQRCLRDAVSPFLPICTLFIVRPIIQVERNVLLGAITPPLPEPASVYVATLRCRRVGKAGVGSR